MFSGKTKHAHICHACVYQLHKYQHYFYHSDCQQDTSSDNMFSCIKQFPEALNWYIFSNLNKTNLSLHCVLGCDATGVLSDTTLTPLSVSSVIVFLLLDFLFESLVWRNLKS